MKKRTIVIVAALVLTSVLMAGCTSNAPNKTTQSSSVNRTANVTIHPTASPTPTPTAVPIATPTPTPRRATSVEGDKEVSLALSSGITRGREITLGFRVMVASPSQIHYLCGRAVNFYIDGQPAGGKREISSPGPENGCWVTASLTLSPGDTAKLSPGTHTLTVDYAGDAAYAPSQFVGSFNVK